MDQQRTPFEVVVAYPGFIDDDAYAKLSTQSHSLGGKLANAFWYATGFLRAQPRGSALYESHRTPA